MATKVRRPYAVTWDRTRRERFMAGKQLVAVHRATRRRMREMFRARQMLSRIEKLRKRLVQRLTQYRERLRLRDKIRTEKRKVRLRVRSRFDRVTFNLPKTTWKMRATGITYLKDVGTVKIGTDQAVCDYTPVQRLDPPRNTTYMQRLRTVSLKSAVTYSDSTQEISLPLCDFAALGLDAYPVVSSVPLPLAFDLAESSRVLLKLQAKVNEATLNMNEYVFEYAQVLRLIKDPYRTALSFHKVLEKWTSRNSWIYIPQRSLRRMHDGSTLVSKVPTGAVLMSMKTREAISPLGVSKSMLDEACNRWLQYRYGIMPLVKDITTVMGMLVDNVPPPLLRSKSARETISKTSESKIYTRRIPPFLFTFRVTREKGVHYSGKQWYTQDDAATPGSYLVGLHPSQAINILWNATPWSFVADWVVNIDQWLTAIREVPWIKYAGNTVTAKEYEVVTSICTSVTHYANPNNKMTMSHYPFARTSQERMNRKIDFPRSTELPVSRSWRSVKNAVTALALLNSNFLLRNK